MSGGTTAFPVRFLLECQGCTHRYTATWPSMPPCPRCNPDGRPPQRLSDDAHGNQRYASLPGDRATILTGRVTDAMIFEQAARTAQERVACVRPARATGAGSGRRIDGYAAPLGPARGLELAVRLRQLPADLLKAVHRNQLTLAEAEARVTR